MQLNDMTLFRQQALIDGQWRDAPNGDMIAVTNPANGEQLGSVPKMGADETREAIEAANRALPAWRALTAKERANISAPLVRSYDGESGRSRPPDDLEQGNRWRKPKAKSATPPPLLSGSPKKVSAFTAIPFPAIRPTNACW